MSILSLENSIVRRQLFRKGLAPLINLNLFSTSTQDSTTIYRQRVTTWVFLICLITTMIVCMMYWLISTQTKTIKIKNPSRIDYETLAAMNLSDLRCPCSQIIIPYSAFLHIEPHFHQMCSSLITSPEWYYALMEIQHQQSTERDDFTSNLGGYFFRTLHTFCSLAKNHVSDSYRVFSSTSLIHVQVISVSVFTNEVSNLMETFIESTTRQFFRYISFMRVITHMTQLASATRSNYGLYLLDNGDVNFFAAMLPFYYIEERRNQSTRQAITDNTTIGDIAHQNTCYNVLCQYHMSILFEQ